jgi:hypothetical protein
MSVKPTSVPTKRLAGSILSTEMAFRVDNILGWDGNALTASDFGTQGYGVFRDSARTRLELFEFDPSTIAASEITINKRGLKFTGDRTTEETDNKFDWTAGDTYVDLGTDTPQLIQYFQDYIDALAIAGSPLASTTISGLVEEATDAQAIAGTATGETGARLFVNPASLPAYVASLTVPITRKYESSGSPHTWTKPAGLKYVSVEVQGAGGQGGTANNGGGGGAGAYAKKTIAAASLGVTETITVGAANAGAGNTSFGAHVTCGNGANASSATAGTGGTATGGDININGQTGGSSNWVSGAGGSSILGMGGPTVGLSTSSAGANNGLAGSGYGAGGGGGTSATDNNPTGSGGSGTQGIVIVTEYYS